MARAEFIAASDYATVSLLDKDLDDVVLTIPFTMPLTGQLRLDGIPRGLNVRLENTDLRAGLPYPRLLVGPVAADGAFSIPEVFIGNYQIAVSDPAYYVKQARYGGLDVSNDPLRLGVARASSLEIQLGRSAVQVSGVIVDSQLLPVAWSSCGSRA
jgi:hypothetical protein